MTDKKIREAVEDLADDSGVSVEEFLLALTKERNSAKSEKFDGLPEDAMASVADAERIRSEERARKRETLEKDNFNRQIDEFVKAFPDVTPDAVPDEVWKDVEDGIPLVYAYAKWKYTSEAEETEEDRINSENLAKQLPIENDRSEPLEYTKEDIEKMTPQNVKSNYKKIINSMKRWKL